MRRFLRMLLLVAPALVLAAGGAVALGGDYSNDQPIETEVLLVRTIPGTNKVLTVFSLWPNDVQECACGVILHRVECLCEMPVMGICLEWES